MALHNNVAYLGVYTGSSVAAASLLSNPIGASSAALFGATVYVTGVAIDWLSRKVVTLKSDTGKLVITICTIVASTFATWKAAEAFGMAMTLKSAMALSATTFGIVFAALLAKEILGACLSSDEPAASTPNQKF